MAEAASILLEKLAQLLALPGNLLNAGIDHVDDDDDVDGVGCVAGVDLPKVEDLCGLLVVEQGEVCACKPPMWCPSLSVTSTSMSIRCGSAGAIAAVLASGVEGTEGAAGTGDCAPAAARTKTP